MSLATLQNLRRAGRRPAVAYVIERERPEWSWLRDDARAVWIAPRRDLRAYDLRALVGLNVIALVGSVSNGLRRVVPEIKRAGGQMIGIADATDAKVWPRHPWAPKLREIAGDEWPDLIKPTLISDWHIFGGR